MVYSCNWPAEWAPSADLDLYNEKQPECRCETLSCLDGISCKRWQFKMPNARFKQYSKIMTRAMPAAAALLVVFSFSPLAARQQSPAPSAPASPQAKPPAAASGEAPSVPVDQIIQKFAQREAEFKIERDNFTYTQTFSIQTLDAGDRIDGEYKMTSDIV